MTEIIWLGHACFLIKTETVRILIDPFLSNPNLPPNYSINNLGVDYILVTHGHGDHLGDSVPLLKRYPNAMLVGIVELCSYVETQGISGNRMIAMNMGGTILLKDGIQVTMVHALHTSGITTPSGQLIYGGVPTGFVIHTPDNHHIYHCGDTAVFGDMKVIDDIYTPDVALLCIGDFYTMGPKEAAYAVNNLLLHCKTVVPMHYGTFGALTGTAEEFGKLITRDGCVMQELEPGKPLKLFNVFRKQMNTPIQCYHKCEKKMRQV